MALLYIETNFLISIATGRDLEANEIAHAPPSGYRLAIPGICFMEASSWMDGEIKRRNKFAHELVPHINELRRDRISSHAAKLRAVLAEAREASDALLKEIDTRLIQAIQLLAKYALILETAPETLLRPKDQALLEQLTDNLILQTILDHARTLNDPRKALLTGDAAFHTLEAREAYRTAGIQPFRSSGDFLSWVQAQGSSQGP